MKKIIIVDHRNTARRRQLEACLHGEDVQVTWIPQVYGSPVLDDNEVSELTEDLKARSANTLKSGDVILLHVGEEQHFIPAILWKGVVHSIPCLLYTALPAQRQGVVGYLNSQVASPMHVPLPSRFYPELPEDWPQSSEGNALRKCVEAILSGLPPKDAVRSAFGDSDLDKILDGLYEKLTPGPENVDLRAIRNDRNALLEAHYEKSRGWKDPAFEQGGA